MAPALRDEEAAMLIPQRPERPALDYGSSNSSSSPSSPRPVQNAPLNGLRHGLGHLGSFLPVCQWLRCYRIENLLGDTVAALTVATIYTPLCVSFSLLAHTEPIKGIYSFTAATFLYALLGHGPGVIIGPEAPGSLLVGTAVALAQHHSGSHNSLDAANLVGLITATTGVILVIAGLTKLGFVNSFMSRPFLRGLMGGIGLTLLIEQAISELGLAGQGSHCAVAYGWGAVGTFRCLLKHLPKANLITTLISALCFAFVMICRTSKRQLQGKYPAVVYVPDRLIALIVATFLTWLYRWDRRGVDILGEVSDPGKSGASFNWPFNPSTTSEVTGILPTSLTIAVIGVAESLLTVKALARPTQPAAEASVPLRTNPELISLGMINFIIGCFMGIPAFGGYGRSKLNQAAGARTLMSSALISLMSLACMNFLMRTFHYIPVCVLAAILSEVAMSILEDIPHDLKYYWKLRAWGELAVVAVIFAFTLAGSITLGVLVGSVLSLVSVARNAVEVSIQSPRRPRESAEMELWDLAARFPTRLTLVSVSDRLTFANMESFKSRLETIALQISAEPKSDSYDEYSGAVDHSLLILDFSGCPDIDGQALQDLQECAKDLLRKKIKTVMCCPSHRPDMDRLFGKMHRGSVIEKYGAANSVLGSYEAALAIVRENYGISGA